MVGWVGGIKAHFHNNQHLCMPNFIIKGLKMLENLLFGVIIVWLCALTYKVFSMDKKKD